MLHINVGDTLAVQVTLDSVNKRAKTFTIHSASEVSLLAQAAERLLEARGVTLANRVGTVLRSRPAGPTARSYDNSAISTLVTLKRGSRDWFLMDAERVTIHPKTKELFDLEVSREAADDIMRKAMKDVRIRVREEA